MESNPENTQKIMTMIMPAQGIASMLKNKSVKETEQGLIIGGEPKEILPPPKPFSTPIDSQTATILSTPILEKVDTTLATPIPEKIDTKESFPNLSEELNKLQIFYSKDAPKNLKDLIDRSVGQEKGIKARDKIFDDDIFEGVLDSDQLNKILTLEQQYTGGIADRGDQAIPSIFEDPFLEQNEEYMTDYQTALSNAARETLGKEFKSYRVMKKEDAMKMLIDGEFPTVKRIQEDKKGNEFYGDLKIIGMDGKETTLDQSAMSFSLSPKEALYFISRPGAGSNELKEDDFVLMEYNANPEDIVMRGHSSEFDLVLRMNEVVGSKNITPNMFKIYDAKFENNNKVNLSENKQFKNFVEESKQQTKKNYAIGGFIDKALPSRSRDI